MGTRRTASPEAASVAPAVSKNPGFHPDARDSKAPVYSDGAAAAGARIQHHHTQRPRVPAPKAMHPKSRMQSRRAVLTLKAALALCPHTRHGLPQDQCVPCQRMTGAIYALEWVMGLRAGIFSPPEG